MQEEQVELELETVPEDEIVIVEAPEEPKIEAKPEITVDDGIEALRRELEAEKAARARAEQQAQQARDQARVATTDKADSDLRMLNTAIETESRNKEILKANLRDAVANGDTDAQADILMAINQTENNLRQINEGKKQYEAQLRAPVADKVEALASQLTPRSAEWVRNNPDVVNDERRAARLQRAHFDALDDGIQPDTPDYFNFLETRLNINKAPAVQQEAAMSTASESTSGRRASAPPAAPVSRSGTGTGGRPNVVTLSRAQQEAARDMGMTPKEYAQNMVALQKAGRL
jgi:hypothetical protein